MARRSAATARTGPSGTLLRTVTLPRGARVRIWAPAVGFASPALTLSVETAVVDLALRTVHLLAAIVWTGGTVALVFVAVPPVQRLQGPERAELLRELGRRWRPIGWSALGIAAVTGVALAQRAHAFHGAPHDFDWVLGVKAVLVGLLIGGRIPARLRARSGSRAPGARRTTAVAPAAPRRNRPHEPRAHDRAPDPRCRARAAAGRLTAFRGRRHGARLFSVADMSSTIGRLDAKLGDGVERAVCAHHRRRLARHGHARAFDPTPAADGTPGWAETASYAPAAGVRAELLVDGAHALPRIAEEIAAAKRHVELAGWFFSPDFRMGTGGPGLRALLADAAERVDVRVLAWAGAPLPLFHPDRREVRQMRDELVARDANLDGARREGAADALPPREARDRRRHASRSSAAST